MLAAKRREHLGQAVGAELDGRAHAQHAGQLVARPMDLGQAPAQRGDEGRDDLVEGRGGRGRRQLAMAADEQLGAELIFELGEALADRGLGHVQLLGREAHAAEPVDVGEHPQAVEIDVH